MNNGLYEGDGVFKTKENTKEGMFRQGKFVRGKVIFPDGTVYEGSIQDGKKTGKGILKKSDGTFYDGYFVNDKFEGKGHLKTNKI